MSAGALRRTDHRPQIMWIAQLIAYNKQRRFPSFLRNTQDFFHRSIFPHRRHCNHALMGMGSAHGVKLAVVRVGHHNSRLFGQCHNLGKRTVRITAGYINFVNRSASAQGLCNSVASFDQTVRQTFLTGLFFPAGPLLRSAVPLFQHRAHSFSSAALTSFSSLLPVSLFHKSTLLQSMFPWINFC